MGILKEQEIDVETEGLIVIRISEADPRCAAILDLRRNYGGVHHVQTFFSSEEILGSEFARLIIDYESGYPQPKNTWVSTKPNYEVLCQRCGIFKQIAPFSIKSEPNLRGKDFMTLIWGSPFLASNEVFQDLESAGIAGFQPWEVIIHPGGQPSETIKQLKILQRSEPGLIDAEEIGYEDCPECGRRKYFAHMRGAMRYRRESFPKDVDILESHEWFGAGSRSAYREVFVSNMLARMIIDKDWKGVMMKAAELVE
jgi:hypothetical protein